MKRYLQYFISLPKTIFFNFKYFPLKIAIKLPVFISHRVLLKKLSGSVTIAKVRTGAVKIGFGDIPLFDSNKSRAVLWIEGKLDFLGTAEIGPGCQLGIVGNLTCGDNFRITGFSSVFVKQRIYFGKGTMMSWDVLIMDQDFHDIWDKNGVIANPAKPITIGDDVWIGCRVMIFKGCNINDGNIIAAGTILTSSLDVNNAIIGENINLRVIKNNMFWRKNI